MPIKHMQLSSHIWAMNNHVQPIHGYSVVMTPSLDVSHLAHIHLPKCIISYPYWWSMRCIHGCGDHPIWVTRQVDAITSLVMIPQWWTYDYHSSDCTCIAERTRVQHGSSSLHVYSLISSECSHKYARRDDILVTTMISSLMGIAYDSTVRHLFRSWNR